MKREVAGMSVVACSSVPVVHHDVMDVEPLFRSGGLAVSRWSCRIRETGGRGTIQHGCYVVKFVHTGAFRAMLADGPVMVDATRTLLAVPGQPFEVTKQYGPAVTGSAIAISGKAMAAILPQGIGRTSMLTKLLRVEVTPRAVLIQQLILRQIRDGAPDAAVEELVISLAREAFREPRVVAMPNRRQMVAPRRDAVEMAQAILAANYDRAVRLEDIARAVEISPFHLCRAFKRVTGVPMRAYVTHLRLRAALGQVVDPAVSLGDIAHEHGFSNHSHFAAAFRKEFRITPSEVRQLATRSVSELCVALGLDTI
jgi:AraC family transcriptional regulator